MFSNRGHCVVVSLVCLLHHIVNCVGQDGVYMNITRQKDGDMLTGYVISNPSCDRWIAVKVSPHSKENCTLQCKCPTINKTYSVRLGKCASEKVILNAENCNGTFLPSSEKALHDLSKPGKAELQVSFLNNQSYSCRISKVSYFNGTNETTFTDRETGFNISAVVNGSALLTWKPQNSSLLSKIEEYGYLLKVRLLCSAITSQHQSSCFMIKTQGRLEKIEPTVKEQRWIHNRCVQKPTKPTNVMLLYILVGVGCACVLIVIVVACFACYTRRRRRLSRRAISNSSRTSASSRKAPKTRTNLTKNNGPTTPAIHDVIFNELSWDGDGGFSNRALADPRVLEVDYGIPIDFGTLPRPESTTSIDSNRNSLSPLTNIGENAQR